MILIADMTRALIAPMQTALHQVGFATSLEYARQPIDSILLAKQHMHIVRVISINLTPTTSVQLMSAQLLIMVLRTIVPQAVIVPRTDDQQVADYATYLGCLPALPMKTPLEQVAAVTITALCEPRPAPIARHHPSVQAMLAQAASMLPALLQLHESAERMRAVQKRQANKEVGRTISVLDALV